MARFRHLLRDRNFFFLWFGQIISNFGDRLNQMALIGLVHSRTPGSTLELAKLISFTVLPVFLIGPIAGIYVDRWNRKYTMIGCDLLRGFLVFIIPLAVIYSRGMLPIYAIVFLVFSITRFFLPSKLSIIPDIVSKDRLLLANSLISTTMMIATILSFGFGGILVFKLGVRGSFYVDSISYFLSAVTIAFIFVKERAQRHIRYERLNSTALSSILEEIKEGFRYLRSHKDVRLVSNILFLLMSGVGAVYVIIIVFIQEALGSATRDLGFLVMFLGLGLFLGSILYGRLGQRFSRQKTMFFALSITGALVILFTILVEQTSSFFLAGAISLLLGVFISPMIVSSNTLMHEVIPDELRGRIFSSLEIIIHIAFLASLLLFSIFGEFVNRYFLLITIGVIFTIAGIFGCASKRYGNAKLYSST